MRNYNSRELRGRLREKLGGMVAIGDRINCVPTGAHVEAALGRIVARLEYWFRGQM
jgi:hypothetical protein